MATRPLRVLLEASALVDARRDAGIGRYARELCAALSVIPGIELTLAAPKRPPWSEARPLRFLSAQAAVLRTAIDAKPDVLHGLGGEPVLGFPSDRQVVTIHDVEMWRAGWPAGVAGAALRRYGAELARRLRDCAAVIAVSRTSAEEAIATLGLDPGRVTMVPHGVSSTFSARPAAIDTDVRQLAGLDGGPYVLWTGSLRHRDPRKGVDVLLDAMARLGSRTGLGSGPAEVTLAVVGSRGAEADRVAEAAHRMRVTLRVCGPRDDAQLASLYRQAAAVAVASNHEGFALPVLEAMACGAPVVATAVGNIPELAGTAALLVPPRDPAALAGALRSVIDDPARAARMREAGPRIAAPFTWERTAQMTAAVYRQVFGKQDFSSSTPGDTRTSPLS